jgi:hypothetical protein
VKIDDGAPNAGCWKCLVRNDIPPFCTRSLPYHSLWDIPGPHWIGSSSMGLSVLVMCAVTMMVRITEYTKLIS